MLVYTSSIFPRLETGSRMRYTISMKDREKGLICRVPPPPDLMIYKEDAPYEKLCLCEYLRELPENPATELAPPK